MIKWFGCVRRSVYENGMLREGKSFEMRHFTLLSLVSGCHLLPIPNYTDHADPLKTIYIQIAQLHTIKLHQHQFETLNRKLFNWFEVEIEAVLLNRDNDGIFDHSFLRMPTYTLNSSGSNFPFLNSSLFSPIKLKRSSITAALSHMAHIMKRSIIKLFIITFNGNDRKMNSECEW